MTRKKNIDTLRQGCSPKDHSPVYLAKMNFKWISIVYFALLLHWNVYGQNASCSKDARTLDSCDGSEVSNNNIYIDFGEIEYQCSCSISPNFSGQAFYTLARNPGYENCGTAVRVIDSNNEKYRLPCATSLGPVVLTNRSGFVELEQVNGIDGPKDYCLRVFTNGILFQG
ncbi:uncharacterized protein LOC134268597 [Saccostrea cucullata]|uniref:uncharacterized protein LOC134268597 n=1 Tax=Saccostrea cuccullata TaxID=36930 RepID=UPI002ED1CF9E